MLCPVPLYWIHKGLYNKRGRAILQCLWAWHNDDLSLGPPATLAPDTFQEEDMKSVEKLNIANILNSQSDLPDPFKGRDGMGGLKKEGTGKPQADPARLGHGKGHAK